MRSHYSRGSSPYSPFKLIVTLTSLLGPKESFAKLFAQKIKSCSYEFTRNI